MPRISVQNFGLAAVCIVGVMALVIWLLYEDYSPSGSGLVSVAAPQAVDAREIIKIEADPFPFAEKVDSMTDARSRLAFDVKLPQLEGGWSPTAIWVSPNTEPEKLQQFQIYFSNGTRLSASRQEKQPR